MRDASLRYPTVLFDWGDTVMVDDPASIIPMVEWETVRVVPGVADVLAHLRAGGRRIVLATSAQISNEDQIRGALARGGLNTYFSKIYCFKNTHLPKGEAFYRHILGDLGTSAAEVCMVGDGFEKDVLAANAAELFAVWFNERTEEMRTGELHVTVHSMEELKEFFESLD